MRVWTLLLLVHCSSSLLPIDVVHVYQTSLASAPLATKSLTSGALYGVGDILAQRRLQLPTWDAKRTVRFAGTGVGSGALWTGWYGFADGLLEPYDPVSRIALALLVEQFFWCPIIFSLYVIPLSAALNGAGVRTLPGEVREQLGPLLLANAKVWTLANVLIYSTPLAYRVLASNGVDLVWAVVCASIAAECGGKGDAASAEACVVQYETEETLEF